MSDIKAFLIAGATGRQGGAVVDALVTHPDFEIRPSQIYALSRNPEGPAAKVLREKYDGIHIISVNLNEPSAIFQQLGEDLSRRTAVFLAQAHGPTEVSDAKAFIDAAATHKVPYFVYSSVDRGGRQLSDEDPSYCKTFSDKYLIEQHLREVCASSRSAAVSMEYTIIRPTWFADNAWWGFPGQLCMTGWRENMRGKKMQVTVTKDIGRWAAEGLLRPDRTGIRNQAVSIASDELDFNEIDDIFKRHTGRGVPVTYGLLARGVIWMVNDLNTMFKFIGERPYGADLAWLRSKLKPTSFVEWVESEVPRRRE
ncbi:nucleoside-diphosphate-sugar epimerase family protein [Colletotrichum sojae]|uniref:Nucleoside-diphosphate-sugar epimerase family protein n=1 Tax=Colletotrichum sojae TaxID=2175907 RepID=A0A8H6MID2_9PEZI|nr:nucleoside-diphosphate-sugar epimerase family protein [Colletotrichum sojae]